MRKYPISISLIFSLSLSLFISCGHHSHEEEEEDDDHHHADSEIILEPQKAKEFGIEYENVAPGKFHDVIKTSGAIEAANSDIVTVSAKKSGIITLQNGVTSGASVANGELLATISPHGIQGGDVNQASLSNLQAAKREYERLKPLHEEKLVTTAAFREAERAYREAEALAGKGNSGGILSISSPAQASIQELFVKTGDYVESGSPLALLVKNSNQVLKADLPAKEIRHLAEISTANFIPAGGSHIMKLKDLNGKKISQGNMTTAQNGYIPVYFSFSGNSMETPGGYAEVFLICNERDGVISVPKDALLEIQGNNYVYVKDHDHSFEKKLVKTGASDGERIEVTEGLEEGETVVAKGASIIRMVEVSAVAPPSHTHNH